MPATILYTATIDANIEWAIGYINAFALYGGDYSDGSLSKTVGVFPEPTAARGNATVISDAARIVLHTRFGIITLKVEDGPAELALLDGRRDPAR